MRYDHSHVNETVVYKGYKGYRGDIGYELRNINYNHNNYNNNNNKNKVARN